jgi:hypothetical protein
MLGTGSAIATADPSSGGHAGSAGSGSHANNRGTAGKPPKITTPPASEVGNHLAQVLRNTINEINTVLTTGRTESQQIVSGTATTKPDPGTSGTTTSTGGSNNSNTTATGTSPDPAGTTTPVGTTTNAPVVDPTVPATVATTEAPRITPIVAINPYGLVPMIVTPVVDVISSVQDMLTSVVDYAGAPMTADLSTLLGVTQQVPPVTNVRTDQTSSPAGSAGMALTPLSFATPAASSLVASAGTAGLPASSSTDPAASGNIEATSVSHASTAPAQTTLTHATAVPMTLKQFFKYAVDEVLRSPSLTALAAFALPGLIGLMIVLGLGMRFGYRQARAALMLPASTLARFARPAPLRLVRSRSLAAISKPAQRFVPTKLTAVDCSLENAA